MAHWTRRQFLESLGAGAATAFAPGLVGCGTRGRRPNFVFMLIDDLGWTDAGVFGSTFHETPHIDALAAAGMRFTDAYAASPVCSPTRASILTGRHPARLNITDWIGGSQRGMLLPAEYDHQLPFEEVTIAEVLREAGYATGFIGKWHLGDDPYLPQAQGFDRNVGGSGAGQPASYFYPYRAPEGRSDYWDVPHLEEGTEGEYLTDRLTDEALRFIDANRERPFLLYLAHYAVHTPIQSKPELTQRYEAKAAALPPADGPACIDESGLGVTKQRQDDPRYAGMVHSVDESVGRVVARLAELGLSDDTVVIFMSDNGGLTTLARGCNAPTAVLPLRAGKGWLYEGGIRAPLIIHWPGVTEPGAVSSIPVTSTDFFPTMLAMAGLALHPELHVDGVNLVPLLRGTGTLDRDALYWHFPHYHGSGNRPSGAVRVGDYKLVEWFEDGRTELYDLRGDIGETTDVSRSLSDVAEDLYGRLVRWREGVDARMPRRGGERS